VCFSTKRDLQLKHKAYCENLGSPGRTHTARRRGRLIGPPDAIVSGSSGADKGERIGGRRNIQISRIAQPDAKRFTVRRIVGAGDLWVAEFILAYDGRPSYSVSVMEFFDGKVARETQ
jgi:hypothetical protein